MDYTGQMSKQDIADMLKIRAKRKEVSRAAYEKYSDHPTTEAQKELLSDLKAALN